MNKLHFLDSENFQGMGSAFSTKLSLDFYPLSHVGRPKSGYKMARTPYNSPVSRAMLYRCLGDHSIRGFEVGPRQIKVAAQFQLAHGWYLMKLNIYVALPGFRTAE